MDQELYVAQLQSPSAPREQGLVTFSKAIGYRLRSANFEDHTLRNFDRKQADAEKTSCLIIFANFLDMNEQRRFLFVAQRNPYGYVFRPNREESGNLARFQIWH